MKRLLIIEDSEDFVSWISLALDADFFTESRHNLKDGIEALTREKFDLVILDLKLPDSSVEATLDQLPGIQTLANCAPVIAMTGHPSGVAHRPDFRDLSLRLQKPFNNADLLAVVKLAITAPKKCYAIQAFADMVMKTQAA
jgi:DNA-binding response OmpR family regulator